MVQQHQRPHGGDLIEWCGAFAVGGLEREVQERVAPVEYGGDDSLGVAFRQRWSGLPQPLGEGDEHHPRPGRRVSGVSEFGGGQAFVDSWTPGSIPVIQEELFVVSDLVIVNDEAGVTVHGGSIAGPVMAAEKYGGAVDDDALGVAFRENAEPVGVEAEIADATHRGAQILARADVADDYSNRTSSFTLKPSGSN
jgi:hypothetical protein